MDKLISFNLNDEATIKDVIISQRRKHILNEIEEIKTEIGICEDSQYGEKLARVKAQQLD